MRLPWRKRELEPAFDPGAGEMPEHLEIYPPAKPFPWRDILRGVPFAVVGGIAASFINLPGCSTSTWSGPVAPSSSPQTVYVVGASASCVELLTGGPGESPTERTMRDDRPCSEMDLALDSTTVLRADGVTLNVEIQSRLLIDYQLLGSTNTLQQRVSKDCFEAATRYGLPWVWTSGDCLG